MASEVTITRKVSAIGGSGKWLGQVEEISFSVIAHTDGTVTDEQTDQIVVGKVVQCTTIPDGTTPPTDRYDITLEDENGIDILEGGGQNRSSSATQHCSSNLWANSKLTLKVANNSVNSAKLKVILLIGTAGISKVGHDTTDIKDGRKVVTTAGTREQLVASSTPCKWVILIAKTDNTGTIVVGGSTVVAALATRQGTPLDAGDSVRLDIDDLYDIYLDATVNGEGVTYLYGV